MPLPAPLLDESKYRTFYHVPHHQENHTSFESPKSLDSISETRNTFDRPASSERPQYERSQSYTSGMLSTIPQHLGTQYEKSTVAINPWLFGNMLLYLHYHNFYLSDKKVLQKIKRSDCLLGTGIF